MRAAGRRALGRSRCCFALAGFCLHLIRLNVLPASGFENVLRSYSLRLCLSDVRKGFAFPAPPFQTFCGSASRPAGGSQQSLSQEGICQCRNGGPEAHRTSPRQSRCAMLFRDSPPHTSGRTAVRRVRCFPKRRSATRLVLSARRRRRSAS